MRHRLAIWSLLGALALCPARAQEEMLPQSPGQGAVLVYGDAPDATVLIDGNRRGVMPAGSETGFRVTVPVGEHTIELRRSVNNHFYDLSAHVRVVVENDALVPVTMPSLTPTPLRDAAARVTAVVDAFLADTVTVPAGSFIMGGRDEEDSADSEFPRHKVTIAQPFLMQKHNVTFDQWDACVADGGCTYVPDDQGRGRGDRGAFNLSWQDARSFAAWISGRLHRECRLPSEAEWEYAARGGTQTAFFFGEDALHIADYVAPGMDHPTAAQPKLPNQYGLWGMVGGLTEWVADCWHTTYRDAPNDGSAWEGGDCQARGARGGIWNAAPWYMRSAQRSAMNSNNRYDYVGFRLVCPVH